MRLAAFLITAALGLPAAADGSCSAPTGAVSLDAVVARVRAEGRRTIFVGERHGVGPVKRFAVDLANALAADGTDVALYVEGFRRGCATVDEGCWSLARAFNRDAFAALLAESRVPVHPLDPAERDRRVERMATTLAGGGESARVVLVGNTHVVHAEDAGAEWLVWGGLRYPQPGDLARAVGGDGSLTIALVTSTDAGVPYRLQHGGCGVHYQLTTADTADYWAGGPPSPGADPARASAGVATTVAAPR